MKKLTKLLRYLTLATIFLLPIGYISSYNASSIESFPGLGHDYMGCHDDTLALSLGGSVSLVLEEEGEITGGTTFDVVATITGFTEAAGQLVVLGFSSARGHNDNFDFEPGYNGAVSVDPSGNAAAEEFSVTAPTSGGEYTITIDALSGGDGYETLNWTYGSLEITVIAAEPDVDIVMTTFLGTIASIATLIIVSILSVKYTLTRRRLILDV